MFLLVGYADRLHLLFREAHDLSIGRFDLVPLPGLSDIIFRFDLVPGLPQIGRRYFGNEHLTGRLVLECSRWENQWQRVGLQAGGVRQEPFGQGKVQAVPEENFLPRAGAGFLRAERPPSENPSRKVYSAGSRGSGSRGRGSPNPSSPKPGCSGLIR